MRYERALLAISHRLNERGLAHRLLSDSARGGSRLALVVEADHVELLVRRRGTEFGLVCLFAGARPGLERFAAALTGCTADANRLARVDRGFMATVEALTGELRRRFAWLASRLPRPALDALRTAVPEAEPMAGLCAMSRRASAFSRQATLIKRVVCQPSCAASVRVGEHRRAARWWPAHGAFDLPPAARRALVGRRGAMAPSELAAVAIAPAVWDSDPTRDEDSFGLADGAEATCDILDALSCAPFELGDCGGLDCFSLSPDCVPLDCGGCG